jgi:hypothetical protein
VTTGEVTLVGLTPNGGSEIWALSIATSAPAQDDSVFCSGFESGEDGSCGGSAIAIP